MENKCNKNLNVIEIISKKLFYIPVLTAVLFCNCNNSLGMSNLNALAAGLATVVTVVDGVVDEVVVWVVVGGGAFTGLGGIVTIGVVVILAGKMGCDIAVDGVGVVVGTAAAVVGAF